MKNILDDFDHTTVSLFNRNGEVHLTGYRKFEFLAALWDGEWWVFHLPTNSPIILQDFGSPEKCAALINDLLHAVNDWDILPIEGTASHAQLVKITQAHCGSATVFALSATKTERQIAHAVKHNPDLKHLN